LSRAADPSRQSVGIRLQIKENGETDLIQAAVIATSLPSRAGLKAILQTDDAIEVVAEAVSIANFTAFSGSVDVVVIMAFPDDSLDWNPEFSQENNLPAVLLLSDTAEHIKSLVELPLRAWGILATDFSEAELIAALYAVGTGLNTFTPTHQKLLETPSITPNRSPVEPPVSLTTREMEVLTLLSDGLANKQTSLELEISEHTVKFHVSSIYQKLNVSNRAEAVRLGIQLGLIMI
jgi:DNA-binding NarL/FixJ family response regulator